MFAVRVCVCVCVCASPPPRFKWSLLLWDGFVLCEASQLNRPWSGEVSSVDPWVTQRQWWPGFYRKNKNRDPRAHGPCCGRGLGMVGHFREKGEEGALHQRGCFGSQVQTWISQVLPSCSLHLGRGFSLQFNRVFISTLNIIRYHLQSGLKFTSSLPHHLCTKLDKGGGV